MLNDGIDDDDDYDDHVDDVCEYFIIKGEFLTIRCLFIDF